MSCFIESKVKVMTNGGKVILQAGLIQWTIRSKVGSVKLGHYPWFIGLLIQEGLAVVNDGDTKGKEWCA